MKHTAAILSLLLAAQAPAAWAAPRRQKLADCRPERVVAPEPSAEARRGLESKLAEARAAYERSPLDADAVIWLGRRTAYLGRFDDAIRVYTDGIRRHPRDARLYRHRGHRYLTVRCFGAAVADLERAARLVRGRPDEVEPDGLPNARGVPTSTLNSNVYYHLGLAHYLRGDFRRALAAYRECLKFSRNPDMLAATAHWLYMTLRRLKRDDEARRVLELVSDDADVIENRDYQRLVLMYKGKVSPEALLAEASKDWTSVSYASTAYGVANWYLYSGQDARATRVLTEIMDGSQTTSFGFIAAEAELLRMGFQNPRGLRLPRRTLY
jgi:tetratricopeptide (TPR) repeat protein